MPADPRPPDAARATSKRAPSGAPAALHLGGESAPSTWRLGEFRVGRLLGEGAMGKVYEAVQESLGRTVALKVLPADFARSPDAVARFEREARSAAELKHPNIVPIYQFGCEAGQHFYAMELVDGRSLRDLLKDPRRPLEDPKKVAKYVLNAALALDYAHGHGVIHRDVKPDNILVRSKDDQVILTDFGLARTDDRRAITQAGALMGTPVYMAPEQALGKEIDRRVDVWALGVTLYELLGGKLPFYSDKLRDLLVQITQEQPPSLRALRPDVPPDLEAIALRCLAKDRAARYGTAKEVADELIRYFRGELVLARQVGPLARLARLARRNRVATTLGVLVVVGVLATLGGTRAVARARAGGRAAEAVVAARALVAGPLRAHAAAAARLEAARAARDALRPGEPPAERRRRRQAAAEDAARALEGLRAAETSLLDGTAAADAPGGRALEHLRAALVVAPEGHPAAEEARALADQLLLALRGRARRAGDAALAAALERERAATGLAPAAGGRRRLSLVTDPPGVRASLRAVRQGARELVLGEPDGLGATPLAGIEVPPGEHLLMLEGDERELRVPLLVDDDQGDIALHLDLPRPGAAPRGFVWIPPGECAVGGDPRAVRALAVERQPAWTDGFFLAEAETTVAEWLQFLADLDPRERAAHLPAPSQVAADGGSLAAAPGAAELAVVGVDLESARAYARWRSSKEPGRRYRLPTDVEWERAARGPAGRAFPWGDAFDPEARPPLSNLHQGDGGRGPPRLRAPRSAPLDRSIFGVYDLAGNASEWVEGAFDGNPRFGVLRGGSWERGPEVVRLASREPIDPADPADLLRVRDRAGVRLALDVE